MANKQPKPEAIKLSKFSFQPAKIFSWVELFVVVVVIFLCAFVYASTLASFLFGLGIFSLFIGLYYLSLILRRRVIFPESFVSKIELDLDLRTLQIDNQKHPLNYIKKIKCWSARGVSQILEFELSKPKKTIKVATPEASKIVQKIEEFKAVKKPK